MISEDEGSPEKCQGTTQGTSHLPLSAGVEEGRNEPSLAAIPGLRWVPLFSSRPRAAGGETRGFCQEPKAQPRPGQGRGGGAQAAPLELKCLLFSAGWRFFMCSLSEGGLREKVGGGESE